MSQEGNVQKVELLKVGLKTDEGDSMKNVHENSTFHALKAK